MSLILSGQPLGYQDFLKKSGGETIPTVNFDPSLATFTAKMAKRSTSVFAASPIVQGAWAADGTTGDTITATRGNQISDYFYENADNYQGSISLWITPEWDGDDGKIHHFVGQNGGSFNFYKTSNNYLRLDMSNWLVTGDLVDISGWTAGTTYHVVVRWDINNTLDGTNYACISVNDSHTFGESSVTSIDATNYWWVGCFRTQDYQAEAIIEGLTIYRRLLYDGTYGVDAGNGDEINLIYASGTGSRPVEITGADDIVFQLPTNGTAGELATGAGNAWSFPWASNELTNWHLQADTAGAPDSWTAVNAPTLADAATADILYDTRSQKISVDAADEGIKQAYSVTAGEDYYIGAWVKTGGAGQGVDVRVYDTNNTANIVELTTDSSAWVLLEACFEVPAGCSSIEVYIESTDADTYDMHVGQVQVLPVLWTDPGMETGTAPTDVATPTTSAQSSEQAHNATNSWKVIADATDEGIKRTITTTANKFYYVSGWVYADTSGTVDMVAGGRTVTTSVNDTWQRLELIMRATTTSMDVSFLSNAAQTFYVDDVSVILLTDVSLTCTAASEANSTEGSGIRVDGYDTCTQDITGQLGATSGRVRFDWTPRHDDADVRDFGFTTPSVLLIRYDGPNYIWLYWLNNNILRLAASVGGVSDTDDWSTGGGAIVAGTTYLVEIEYNSSQCTFTIDGTLRATAEPAGGINFGANIPNTIYVGQNSANTTQSDAVFAAPT